MRVVVVAGGTRGDVQPMVPLAKGIRAAGHDVTVAASADVEHSVTEHGLCFRRLEEAIADRLTGVAGRAWIADSAGRPFRELRHLKRVYADVAEPLAEGLLGLVGTADLFVSGILTLDAVASIARYDGAQHAIALLCPYHPTADGRSGLTAQNPVTRSSNLTRTRIGRWLLSRSVTQAGQVVRQRLGVAETGPRGYVRTLDNTNAVLGVSPLLVPPPHDWPRSVTVTGPWTLPAPEGWQPPPLLADFLTDGPPPICLGFGSMSVVQPDRIQQVAVAAAHAAGQRLILVGTNLVGPQGDDVLGVDAVPHGWLFPRVRGVVHHGGAGTTHAALLAGTPQCAVPHVADQPYWGRRIHEEGLGPAPLALNRLTAARLADRLRQLACSPDLAARAQSLGRRARQEEGVRNAVAALGL